MAILFHDIGLLYQNDNSSEYHSCKKLEEFVEMAIIHNDSRINQDSYSLILSLIMMTEGHHVKEDDKIIFKIFHDLNMSILGSDREDYIEYVNNIRNEVIGHGFTEEEFNEGRLKFLQNLPDEIFVTEEMKPLNEIAKLNIQNEIKSLTEIRI